LRMANRSITDPGGEPSIQTRPPPGGFGLSRSQWFSAATKYITRTGDFVI
jgi:hypothetical protein